MATASSMLSSFASSMNLLPHASARLSQQELLALALE